MNETVKLDPEILFLADRFSFTLGFGMTTFRDTKSVSWDKHLKTAAEMALKARQTLIEADQPADYMTVYLSVSTANRIDTIVCTFDFIDVDDGKWIAKPRSEDVRAFRDLDRRLRRFLN